MAEMPEDPIVARLRERGVEIDAARAAELRPLLESLLARLGRIGGADRPGLVPPPDRLPGSGS